VFLCQGLKMAHIRAETSHRVIRSFESFKYNKHFEAIREGCRQ
jgi:hypothetical protein